MITFILLALFGGVITSFFAVEKLKPPFSNMDEFLAVKNYKILLHYISETQQLLEVQNEN